MKTQADLTEIFKRMHMDPDFRVRVFKRNLCPACTFLDDIVDDRCATKIAVVVRLAHSLELEAESCE